MSRTPKGTGKAGAAAAALPETLFERLQRALDEFRSQSPPSKDRPEPTRQMEPSSAPVDQSVSKVWENLLKSDFMQLGRFKSKVVRYMLSEGEDDLNALLSAMKLAKQAEPLMRLILKASGQSGESSDEDLEPIQIELANLLSALGPGVQGPAASFEAAARLALPPRAPKVWAKHEDREPGENVLDFLKRVWGPYWDVLYQSDIKALGDPGLVPAVRAYCHRHSIDPAGVLPPPKRARLDRALAEVEPGSSAAAILQGRMRNREALARRRKAGRPKP